MQVRAAGTHPHGDGSQSQEITFFNAQLCQTNITRNQVGTKTWKIGRNKYIKYVFQKCRFFADSVPQQIRTSVIIPEFKAPVRVQPPPRADFMTSEPQLSLPHQRRPRGLAMPSLGQLAKARYFTGISSVFQVWCKILGIFQSVLAARYTAQHLQHLRCSFRSVSRKSTGSMFSWMQHVHISFRKEVQRAFQHVTYIFHNGDMKLTARSSWLD